MIEAALYNSNPGGFIVFGGDAVQATQSIEIT